MNKTVMEMRMYKEKYGKKYTSYSLFEEIFIKENVSEEFLNKFGEEKFPHPAYEQYSDIDENVSVWSLFFQNTPLTMDIIRKYESHPSFIEVVHNDTFNKDMVLYLLKKYGTALDKEWFTKLSAETQLTEQMIIENIQNINIDMMMDNRFDISASLVEYLFKEGYLTYLTNGRTWFIKGITIDFIKNHRTKISISGLSENNHLDEEVAWYLIRNYPKELSWDDLLSKVALDLETAKENWARIENYVDFSSIPNYYRVASDLLEYLLDMTLKNEPYEIDWCDVSRTQTFDYNLFAKYYKYLDVEAVFKNDHITNEELMLMEKHHKLKSMFTD